MPKKHHDFHGKDASVAATGDHIIPSKQHWEKHYEPCPKVTNTPAGAFVPKSGKIRPQPHRKVNELDH